MDSPESNKEMMIDSSEEKKTDPKYIEIKVNTVIDLEQHNKHDHHSKKKHPPLINLHLKNAFCVADVKYSEECRCGKSKFIEVAFCDNTKQMFKNPKDLDLKIFEYVIVEVECGLELVTVIACAKEAEEHLKINYRNEEPKYSVIRKATPDDLRIMKKNHRSEPFIVEKTKTLVTKHKLDMKITAAEWQFDRKRLTIFFTAPQRIDFRNLVKDLARIFKTRIELRQISTREEARRIGGIGPCGLTICCASFTNSHCHVTLEHARHQLLSNNAAKLSGYCGRLKCCLLYEHDTYVEVLKKYPPVHSIVNTNEGKAQLYKIDVFKEHATLYYPETGVYKMIPGTQLLKLVKSGKVEFLKKDSHCKNLEIDDEELSQLEAEY